MNTNSLLSVALVGMALLHLAQEGHGLRCEIGDTKRGFRQYECLKTGDGSGEDSEAWCRHTKKRISCYTFTQNEGGFVDKWCDCVKPEDENRCRDDAHVEIKGRSCWCDTDLCNEDAGTKGTGSLSKISTPALLLASSIVLAIHLI